MLHLGELGDGTDRLLEYLDTHDGRPPRQIRFETVERLPMADFPVPAYSLIWLRQYFIASIQFSSGCPYACEFCDIPGLYGRNPRLKTPEQVLRELDEIVAAGAVSVYFVDDNFIANQRAAQELLPHLIEWQVRNRYPLRFACERPSTSPRTSGCSPSCALRASIPCSAGSRRPSPMPCEPSPRTRISACRC